MTITKLLIANRGEIACRVIKTAKRLNIATVAVYSEIDQHSQHVALADEAYCIGPAPSNQSYLCADKIIATAKDSGCQAIHPGYGFLSENAHFSQQCADNGIIFVGPKACAIEAMGSKAAAKQLMKQSGVPTTPGYEGDDQSLERLQQEAERIGYPVLIKASAGGGGKGMRLASSAAEFKDAVTSAKREALSSFGDDELLLEKYLANARHVEVQIFCDNHGNGVYLYDRDCSVQRRHQKIIEEAPAPGIDMATKQRMGEAAIAAAKAIDYCGAGTIEFLYDGPDNYYFMEMNTRLQVEHPVTEMITGLDLVEWQLNVAADQPLPLQQTDIEISGHAFEARICAEDPDDDFKPSCGTLDILDMPRPNKHVRIDSGVRQGDNISPYYDPMIAKLISWDSDRERALKQLHHALDNTTILGVASNVDLLNRITQHHAFQSAELSTRFLDTHNELTSATHEVSDNEIALASLCYQILAQQQPRRGHLNSNDNFSPWLQHDHWRISIQPETLLFWVNDQQLHVNIERGQTLHHYIVHHNGSSIDVACQWHERSWFDISINDIAVRVKAVLHESILYLTLNQRTLAFGTRPPGSGDLNHGGQSELAAPMPGTIIEVLVETGQSVKVGDALIVMEAMKMENTIKAPYDGTVEAIHFNQGETFSEGNELLSVTPN